MHRRRFLATASTGLAGLISLTAISSEAQTILAGSQWQLAIVGATPAGIMAAIAAARAGLDKIILLERTGHIGGLPANGLGATDIATKGCTGGLFMEFVNNIKAYYVKTYGADSQQVKDSTGGYHFEPSVAEKMLHQMIEAEGKKITIKLHQQLERVELNKQKTAISAVYMQDISKGRVDVGAKTTPFLAKQFIDATYEGDLMALAGVPFSVGREAKSLYNEPGAGRIYKYWKGEEGPGSTGEGDNTIQAYNYRLCLTDNPEKAVRIPKPATYNREEYVSLIDDLHTGRFTGVEMKQVTEQMLEDNRKKSLAGQEATLPGLPRGLRRLLNPVKLPNGKTDSNNQHWAFISSDLPEENWPYPTASWAWRDKFAARLRDYTLGLVYFAQNDPDVPLWYRDQIKQWGLANDEYTDNGNFPRQVYVREARRMKGMYLFKAQDALPPKYPSDMEGRSPFHATTITTSHYALDSHACRKREPGKIHLEGFLSYHTVPYTVPVGVILPEQITNLTVPVAVSGTHIGFSTLRMEPCWMALGQAAGIIASDAISSKKPVQAYNEVKALRKIQYQLAEQKAVLVYFKDLPLDHKYFVPIQAVAAHGLFQDWAIRPDDRITTDDINGLMAQLEQQKISMPKPMGTFETRGQFLNALYLQLKG